MPDLHDLFVTGHPPIRLLEGRVARAPTGLDDDLFVTVDAFDRVHEHGPCPWMPRGALLPARGDRCLVAIAADEDGDPSPWVVAWWPYD